jgi:WD40 repeat protein
MQGGVDFTSSGKYMALAERRDCKDHVSLFDCSQWQLVQHFPVETADLAGLSWSPNGTVLCVWDSILDYKIYLYSLDGRCLASYSAYEHALGVKCVKWSPTSQFLAIGSFDQKLRVLNHVTWKMVGEYFHSPTLGTESMAVVYTEVESKKERFKTTTEPVSELRSRIEGTLFLSQSKYETRELPVTIPVVKADPEKPTPKLGVGTILFSPDSRYVATKNDSMPNAVWVWDMAHLQLCVVLLQTGPVREIQWDPTQPRLAVCTSNNKLYLWSPAGCVSVTVPIAANFTVQRLAWNPNGKALALIGSSHFCVCYTLDATSDTL